MADLFMIGVWQILLLATAALCLGITLYALVDILKSEFSGQNKIAWLLVVIFITFFGAVLYLLIGRQQKISTQ